MTGTTLPSALPASPYALTVTPPKTPTAPPGTVYVRISGPHGAEWVNAGDLRAALDKIDPPNATNQTRADQPRPLTADDITDEMVERAARENGHAGNPNAVIRGHFRRVLTAALTESPARPEGLVALIDAIREATYDPEPVATGEALYSAGVRVVSEEQS